MTSAFGVTHDVTQLARGGRRLVARPMLNRAAKQIKTKVNYHAMVHGPKIMSAIEDPFGLVINKSGRAEAVP